MSSTTIIPTKDAFAKKMAEIDALAEKRSLMEAHQRDSDTQLIHFMNHIHRTSMDNAQKNHNEVIGGPWPLVLVTSALTFTLWMKRI